MITERQLRKVVESAGYEIVSLTRPAHYDLCVKDTTSKVVRLSVSVSPRSKSHWQYFVLADIKRKMRQS